MPMPHHPPHDFMASPHDFMLLPPPGPHDFKHLPDNCIIIEDIDDMPMKHPMAMGPMPKDGK